MGLSWRWGLGFRTEYLGMSFAGFAERVRVDVGCAHQDAGVGILGGFSRDQRRLRYSRCVAGWMRLQEFDHEGLVVHVNWASNDGLVERGRCGSHIEDSIFDIQAELDLVD